MIIIDIPTSPNFSAIIRQQAAMRGKANGNPKHAPK